MTNWIPESSKKTGTTGTTGTLEYYKSPKRLNDNNIQNTKCFFPKVKNLGKGAEIIKNPLSQA